MTESDGISAMDVDVPRHEESAPPVNGDSAPLQNGFSNGVEDGEPKKHSSSRDKHSSSSSSKHHSSSKDKHNSSSSSKDKHRSSSSHKSHSSSSSGHKSSSGSSSRDKDKHSSSSSRDKDRHSSSKDKHRSSSSSKDKHSSSSSKDKSSSSSSSKDKHSSSSSRDKSSSSSSKDKDRKHGSSSSSSKHGSSSSSSKHGSSSSKHGSSSSSKDKHSSSSKHGSSSKHSSSSSSKKDGHSSSKSNDEKPVENHVNSDSNLGFSPKLEADDFIPKDFVVKDEPVTPMKVEPEPFISDEEPNLVIKEEPVKEEWDGDGADSEDDVPLSARKRVKEEDSDYDPEPVKKKKAVKEECYEDEDSDDEPLSSRMKKKKTPAKKRKAEDDGPPKKKAKKSPAVKQEAPMKTGPTKGSPTKKAGGQAEGGVKWKWWEEKHEDDGTKWKFLEHKGPGPTKGSPTKKAGGQAEGGVKWKWWEEKREDDGTKWKFLEHKGPVLAPAYEPVPPEVKFFYDGQPMKLSLETEEVATFYARMLEHDYTTMETFNTNFMKDWRSVMTKEEKANITDLTKCNFKQMAAYFKDLSERRKNKTKEEKLRLKEENAALQEEFGFCLMDGHREKIGNFKIEPPGLFRGRGSHPKMGMLKKRTMPENVIINCSKDAKVPDPPEGHRWKEVRHDNSVTWLACWVENVQGQTKYVMLNPASKLKGEKDWAKYQVARELHKCVDKIRANYYDDFKSKEMRIRQRAVAMYFIDKLALRAGNEKDEETADTVGCCSLRVEHIKLHEEMDGKPFVVEFDFLGKDSIRYYNKVAVEKRVFKNLQLFMDNKNEGDDLFDRLNTAVLNKHLQGLMDGLTAKVFRTYNASKTLQEQLDLLTVEDDPIPSKLLSYNRANRKVAILCNHQRAAPKNFEKQMENLQVKIDAKKQNVKEAKKQMKEAKAEYKASKSDKNKSAFEKKKKAVERIEMQLTKLEVAATDKDENKEIALGTSKLNYLDPRISVGWSKKWDVPVEKIYNKTQRDKFAWAIDMAEADFKF